jgi:hypothetical protein
MSGSRIRMFVLEDERYDAFALLSNSAAEGGI